MGDENATRVSSKGSQFYHMVGAEARTSVDILDLTSQLEEVGMVRRVFEMMAEMFRSIVKENDCRRVSFQDERSKP